MKSDTRANLIFLLVFAVLMAPGAIIVGRKALRGESRALKAMQPPLVRKQLAFMDPTLAVGAHASFVPPIAGALASRLAARVTSLQPGLTSVVERGGFEPVMSDRYNLQLLGTGVDDGKYLVALLAWNGRFHPLPTHYTITGTRADGGTAVGTMYAREERNMPLEVRAELQDAGYIRPPDGVMWMLVSFPGTAPVERVRVEYQFDAFRADDTLQLLPAARDASPATRPSTP